MLMSIMTILNLVRFNPVIPNFMRLVCVLKGITMQLSIIVCHYIKLAWPGGLALGFAEHF